MKQRLEEKNIFVGLLAEQVWHFQVFVEGLMKASPGLSPMEQKLQYAKDHPQKVMTRMKSGDIIFVDKSIVTADLASKYFFFFLSCNQVTQVVEKEQEERNKAEVQAENKAEEKSKDEPNKGDSKQEESKEEEELEEGEI